MNNFFQHCAATHSGVSYFTNLGCVKMFSNTANWYDARDNCQSIGGHLATFHPQTGHQDLKDFMNSVGKNLVINVLKSNSNNRGVLSFSSCLVVSHLHL